MTLNQGTAIKITHSNPWAAAMHQVCVSYDGVVLDFVPCGGIGRVIPYPQPSILALVISDREGLFGRRCPSCNSYFRSNFLTSTTHCPYCGQEARGIEFLTENQLQFIGEFCRTFVEAHTKRQTISIDLDVLINKLPQNSPGWVYSEERQQTKHECVKCRCIYDILGEYGICPSCGRPNFQEVIDAKLDTLDAQFKAADETLEERHKREVEWEKLTRCISEFEALAKSIRTHLLKLPLAPKRRTDLSQLNFQRVLNAAERIEEWYGFDLLQGISDEDKQFFKVDV